MAQLSDDCFAFGGSLLSVDSALAEILRLAAPVVSHSSVSLANAFGKILALPIISRINVPPYDNSAVDGYAVCFDDLNLQGATELPVVGRITAGHPLPHGMAKGSSVRIFTGAPLPMAAQGGSKADTIFMEEDCLENDGLVRVPAGLKRGANLRQTGEDIHTDQEVLSAGTRIFAPEIAMAAAVGADQVTVFAPLKVGLFSTGDEVMDISQSLAQGKIYDTNRPMIYAALEGLGAQIYDYGILPDDKAHISKTLSKAADECDLLISSAGMSLGEEDYVRRLMESQGELKFWRLAMKPGRPVGLGSLKSGAGRQCLFLGLPGNPVAALTTFFVLARPLIKSLAGASYNPPLSFRIKLGFAYRKKPGRTEFVRVHLQKALDGEQVAIKHGKSGAAILSSVIGADGFAVMPEQVENLSKGAYVDFISFTEFCL